MDTLLGLSIRPATVGWVLVDGSDIDTTLARAEVTVGRHRGGVGAVDTSQQVTAVVQRAQAMLKAQGRRLGGVGVTWSADAAAEAALLLEYLAGAGFDNVVPVRLDRAAEAMAEGIGGSEQAAVCVIEPGSATLVMAHDSGNDASAVIRQSLDREVGADYLVNWLTTLFERGASRPDVLVIAGPDECRDALAVRLEAELTMPVFVQAGVQLALARGAALAGPGMGIADTGPDEASPPDADKGEAGRRRSQALPYAGALVMLAVSVPTFVVSLSVVLSLQLAPAHDRRPAEQIAQAAQMAQAAQTAQVAQVAQVAITPPAPASPPAEAPGPSIDAMPEGAAAFQPVWELPPFGEEVAAQVTPAPAVAPQPDPSPSLLSRALNRLRNLHGH